MAGPSVVVRVLGDLRGLGAAMDGAGKNASSAAQRAHSAFSGMLSNLNRTGVLGPFGAALDGVDAAIGAMVDHAHEVGPMMAGVGAGVAAAGAVLTAFGSKEQASHQQLQAAIQATGHEYDDYGKQIQQAIKHQENFGHTASETQDALRILTQATHDPAKALQYLNTTADLSAAKGYGLAQAATTLGRAYNGNTKVLKEFGITAAPKAAQATAALARANTQAISAHDKLRLAQQHLADVQENLRGKTNLTASQQHTLRDALQRVGAASDTARAADARLITAKENVKKGAQGAQTNIDKLSAVLRGQASASADTFSGRLHAMTAKVEDALSTFGQKWGPIMQTAGIALMSLGSMMTIFGGITWATMLPILAVIAAIVALIAIGYVIYRNWNTIWTAIKAVVTGVWDWIKGHWPLLLAILTGPIGIAVLIIIRNFDTIRNAIATFVGWLRSAWNAVWAFMSAIVSGAANTIRSIWNGIASFFTGIVSRVRSILGGIFDTAKNAAGTVVNVIEGAWGGVTRFFSDVVSGITKTFAGIGSAISGPFRAAWNAIASGWNSTVGRLSFTVPGWVPVMGGKGFSMPTIPTLETGGLITATGLIYAHAGEAVIPAPQVAGLGGPAVNIEHAHFAETLDVDVFMRRAAWEMQRQRV